MTKYKTFLVFLLLFISVYTYPQEIKNVREGESQEVPLGSRILSEFASPLMTKARYVVGGSLIAAGMVYINKGKRTYNKRESFESARPFGKLGPVGETLGWGFLNGIYTIAHFYNGYANGSRESLRASEHMLKASFYTLSATMALKTLISERRPGYPDDRASFPSGHSSMSFAFASVVAARHGWLYGSIAYGTATFISVSRINDDWHYLHDVLIGMGIGAAYGWGLHYLFEKELPYQFAVIPSPKGGIVQVGMTF